jgi:hypothetical protein
MIFTLYSSKIPPFLGKYLNFEFFSFSKFFKSNIVKKGEAVENLLHPLKSQEEARNLKSQVLYVKFGSMRLKKSPKK